MHTFSQDGVTVNFNADLSGEIEITERIPVDNPALALTVALPAGFLQEWLKQAGFWLTPRLPEDPTLADVDKCLQGCEGWIRSAIGMAGDCDALQTTKHLWKALEKVRQGRDALPKEDVQ